MSAPAGPPSQGVCSVRLRLTLEVMGGVNQFPAGTPETLNPTGNLTETRARVGVGGRRRLLQASATCSTLTFTDTLNVLDVSCPMSQKKVPYEPCLARALVAHERAVRHGPDPV
jgi:hypothetical protein